VTTLTKDPHGDVDEPQFIDASKLVSKDVQLQTVLACNINLSLDNSCYHAWSYPVNKRIFHFQVYEGIRDIRKAVLAGKVSQCTVLYSTLLLKGLSHAILCNFV